MLSYPIQTTRVLIGSKVDTTRTAVTLTAAYDVANKEVSDVENQEYNTTILALQYFLAPEAVLILQIDIMDWSNDMTGADAEEIAANRVALGMRLTF